MEAQYLQKTTSQPPSAAAAPTGDLVRREALRKRGTELLKRQRTRVAARGARGKQKPPRAATVAAGVVPAEETTATRAEEGEEADEVREFLAEA